MPVRRIYAPVETRLAINAFGFREEIRAVDFCEVDPETLAVFLRDARDASPPSRRATARRGVALAHGRFTWSRVATVMTRELRALAAGGTSVHARRRRVERPRAERTLEIARQLLLGG